MEDFPEYLLLEEELDHEKDELLLKLLKNEKPDSFKRKQKYSTSNKYCFTSLKNYSSW